jgi:hypothetical protein
MIVLSMIVVRSVRRIRTPFVNEILAIFMLAIVSAAASSVGGAHLNASR